MADLNEQARRKLRVTWEGDDATDARIDDDILPNAEAWMRFRLGIPDEAEFDFAAPGPENTLLLAYCYYLWNDAEDEFEGNYGPLLAQTRRKWEVTQYAEEKAASADV